MYIYTMYIYSKRGAKNWFRSSFLWIHPMVILW